VKANACTAVSGVPERVTVLATLGLSVILLGSAPALTVQRKGATPPLAWIGWLYGVSKVPLGNEAVVITGAVGAVWVGPPQLANATNNIRTVT
jgi:hypothetical protein